jgi:predicted GNAT superfamily acetyltransferase
MDIARLDKLAGLACYHKVACVEGRVVGFLLAMRRGAPYENPNFDWFSRSYPDFLYIDRIVVAGAYRGLKLGSQLYDDLFGFARGDDIPLITCEYNIVPPNGPSQRFHASFGFTEQGTQWVDNGARQVSLQVAPT